MKNCTVNERLSDTAAIIEQFERQLSLNMSDIAVANLLENRTTNLPQHKSSCPQTYLDRPVCCPTNRVAQASFEDTFANPNAFEFN